MTGGTDNTGKFTGLSEVYARARPGYPAECFEVLLRALGPARSPVVADIGAGTGKFTAGLLERGLQVSAVEPNADMLSRLEAGLGGDPRLSTVRAPAEATGLPEASVDLVTVAQAFHWLDPQAFAAECRRILRPEGRVALIWNFRRAEDPSVQATVRAFRRHAEGFVALTLGEQVTADDLARFYGPGRHEYTVVDNDEDIDRETFLGRYLSASYFPKEGDPGREPLVEELEQIFAEFSVDGVYRFPQATHIHVGEMS